MTMTLTRSTLPNFAAALLVGLMALSPAWVGATDLYVSLDATPAAPYDTWATGFNNLQDALDYTAGGGVLTTRIYLAGQEFSGGPIAATHPDNTVFRLQNATNVIIRGGYEANPALDVSAHPGLRDPALHPTVLRRTTGNARVLSLLAVEDVRLESVTLRDGVPSLAYSHGGGVLLSDCRDVVFDDCRILENNAIFAGYQYGKGLALTQSSLILTNCLVADNGLAVPSTSHYARGGGAYVGPASRLVVWHSTFRGNRARGGTTSGRYGYGGGIYVDAAAELEVRESILRDNDSFGSFAAPVGGAIYNLSGTVLLRNALIAGNAAVGSDGVYSSGTGAHLMLDNCTVVDNNGGALGNVGIAYAGGTIALTNSIVWGHDTDLRDLPVDAQGRFPDVWHSNFGDNRNAGFQGCLSLDPLFADTEYYHLASSAGHYSGGGFEGGEWAVAAENSWMIASGHPGSDYSREPEPNGGRVNLGAYGNTSVASKLDAVSVLPAAVGNLGYHSRARRAVYLRGELTATGGQTPIVALDVWPDGGGETHTVELGLLPVGAFESPVFNLSPGTSYHFRISATNRAGWVYSLTNTFSTLPAGTSQAYVSPAGDSRDGTTWAAAYTNLNWALQHAEPGDVLHLAGQTFSGAPIAGTHPDNTVFRLRNATNVVIRGGYEANPALGVEAHPGARDPALHATVLRRESGNARVLSLLSAANVRLESVTLREGAPSLVNSHGGGVYLSDCRDVVFEDCRILNNKADYAGHQYGNGLALDQSSLILTNCLVADNGPATPSSAHYARGGGAYVGAGSRLVAWHSTFSGNKANGGTSSGRNGYGGGIYVDAAGELDLQASSLVDNEASRGHANAPPFGGAIYNNAGTALLRNARITGNRVGVNTVRSDGIYTTGSGARIVIENCTIADNNSATAGNVAIRYNGGVLALTNTIVWGHAEDLSNLPIDGEGRLLNVSHSLFNIPVMQGIAGCIVADPLFVDSVGGDYRLKDGATAYGGAISPAIHSGLSQPWMAGATDLDGRRRVQGGGVDLGAYEAAVPPGTIMVVR